MDLNFQKPPHLRPGDTIGIVSPSWSGAALFPHRLQAGLAQLERMGYRVKIAPHALGNSGYVSATPEQRASDINAMFADPSVNAILATVGGDHSCQLLPHLDYDLIRRKPKIFIGYSDITVLNVALHVRTGVVTFNGPALITEFAEFPQMFAYTASHFLRAVSQPEPIGVIDSSPTWTEEYLDWGQQLDLTRPRAIQPNAGVQWLKHGRATGRLLGGCLESLDHLRGTAFWPTWDGAILFLETSEEQPSPAWVDARLMDYENMGVLARINGLIIGRSMGYSSVMRQDLWRIVVEHTRAYTFPILAELDFGHTAPQFTIPLGVQAQLDSAAGTFAIIEAAVQ